VIYSLGERQPVLEGDGHFIAPNASVIGSVRLKAGSSVWFNAVLRGDNDWIVVGENSNVQDGAILHTDPGITLTVGDGVTIGHRAMLHGCEVGNNSLIGIGSTLLNHSSIGCDTVVGAHTLVAEGKQYPDGVLLLGSPATVVRELDAKEIEMLRLSASVYTKQSARFSRDLQPVD
jgi:carbonic anhydrase/acetyltransferase-like protein (isoleucine patch superfamily)